MYPRKQYRKRESAECDSGDLEQLPIQVIESFATLASNVSSAPIECQWLKARESATAR